MNNITMENFRHAISKDLISKTSVEKRSIQKVSKIQTVSVKNHKPHVPFMIRFEQVAHQPKRGTRRKCARCSTIPLRSMDVYIRF